MLNLTVSPKVLPFIRDIRDPAVAWRFLNEKYNTHTIADAMTLRNQWASFSMTDKMDVVTFMQSIAELLNELRNVGVIIDNDTAVHKILTELPSRFEIFVRTILNEPRMPSLDNLGARLHLEESNLKLRSGNSSEEALVMRFRHMIRQGPQRKSFGHHASAAVESGGRPNYEPSRGPSNRGDVIFCFRCNQQGHIARYCVAPSSVVQPPRRQSFGAHTEEIMLDPNEESFQTALQALSLESEDNNWIIDS